MGEVDKASEYPVLYTHFSEVDAELAEALAPFRLEYDETFSVGGASGLGPEIALLLHSAAPFFYSAAYDALKSAFVRAWKAKTKRPLRTPPIQGSGPALLNLYVDLDGIGRVHLYLSAQTAEELMPALGILPSVLHEVKQGDVLVRYWNGNTQTWDS